MSHRGMVDPVNDNGMCHAGKALSGARDEWKSISM